MLINATRCPRQLCLLSKVGVKFEYNEINSRKVFAYRHADFFFPLCLIDICIGECKSLTYIVHQRILRKRRQRREHLAACLGHNNNALTIYSFFRIASCKMTESNILIYNIWSLLRHVKTINCPKTMPITYKSICFAFRTARSPRWRLNIFFFSFCLFSFCFFNSNNENHSKFVNLLTMWSQKESLVIDLWIAMGKVGAIVDAGTRCCRCCDPQHSIRRWFGKRWKSQIRRKQNWICANQNFSPIVCITCPTFR